MTWWVYFLLALSLRPHTSGSATPNLATPAFITAVVQPLFSSQSPSALRNAISVWSRPVWWRSYFPHTDLGNAIGYFSNRIYRVPQKSAIKFKCNSCARKAYNQTNILLRICYYVWISYTKIFWFYLFSKLFHRPFRQTLSLDRKNLQARATSSWSNSHKLSLTLVLMLEYCCSI